MSPQLNILCEVEPTTDAALSVILGENNGEYLTMIRSTEDKSLHFTHAFPKAFDGALSGAITDFCRRFSDYNNGDLEPLWDDLLKAENIPVLVGQ